MSKTGEGFGTIKGVIKGMRILKQIMFALAFLILMTNPVVGATKSVSDKDTTVTAVYKSDKHSVKNLSNNPFGIKNARGSNWKGTTKKIGSYARFSDVKYAIRALVRILERYQNEKHCYTTNKIVSRYTGMTNISDYISFINKRLGIKSGDKIKLFDEKGNIVNEDLLIKFIHAIQFKESGYRYNLSKEDIQNGINIYKEDYIKKSN